MKKYIFAITCTLSLLISCSDLETPRAELLEYHIGGALYTNKGYAFKYTDYRGTEKQGFDWHIYDLGQSSLYIQAYDTSLTKTIFPFPDFEAEFNVELADGKSKTYRATSGEFRITGQEMGDVIGDFHMRVKNMEDPNDSLSITSGFYRIWLERYDRIFTSYSFPH